MRFSGAEAVDVRSLLATGAGGLLLLLFAVSCARVDRAVSGEASCEGEILSLIPGLQARVEAWRELRFRSPVVSACLPSDRDHVAGWYDSETRRLYIDPTVRGRFGEGVLLHELVHALQDDHYGLESLKRRAGESEERQAALTTIIEGEAMLAVMELLDYDFERVVENMTAADEPPPVDAAPYLDGSRFIRELRDLCGWEGVDALCRNLPHTREEIAPGSLQAPGGPGARATECPDRFRAPEQDGPRTDPE